MLHVIEERKAGSWTFYRLAKDADDAAKGVAAMRLANPEWEVRTAEYARVDRHRWDIEFRNTQTPERWRLWNICDRDGYPTEEAARADLEEARGQFPLAPYRLTCTSEGRRVVETFAPKGGV